MDAAMKTKMALYNQTKTAMTSRERKQGGSLMVRNLADLVQRDDMVLDSEYLETLLVVVPKYLQSTFLAEYERLCAMVVPRSSQYVGSGNWSFWNMCILSIGDGW